MSGKKTSQQKRSGLLTRRRPQVVIAVALVLTLFAAWTMLAYSGALDRVFSQKAEKKGPVSLASFTSPSKDYIYAGGRLVATEEPQSSAPAYQGYHDGAGCSTISGWAWDQNNPSSMVNVDIYDGSTLLATVAAGMYREDLLNVLASPYHGFSYPTPSALKNGAVHTINVKFPATNTLLQNSARSIQCSGAANFQGSLDGTGCTNISGWAWDSNDPNGTVNVDIYNGATLIGTIAATLNRQDLIPFLGSPYHGFTFPTPLSLKDGQPHTITVKYGGTNTPLTWNNPRTFACSSTTRNLLGSHDVANCTTVSGYAWDTNDDGGVINVAIFGDGNLLAVVPAQLVLPGIGNGYHGFSFPVPASLKDGQPHSILIRFSGTSTNLANTPRTITCFP